MRIAISGAHRTGKTTLIEELSRALPTYTVVDEPYYLLEEEGYELEELPSVEDFELQLERSIEGMADPGKDRLFDRCPADLLAYLISHPDAGRYDVKPWLPRVRDAMQGLDLIVFVPIETPDRFRVLDPEDADLRQRVDEELREIVLGDRWDFDVEAMEVTGSIRERARQVLAQVTGNRRPET